MRRDYTREHFHHFHALSSMKTHYLRAAAALAAALTTALAPIAASAQTTYEYRIPKRGLVKGEALSVSLPTAIGTQVFDVTMLFKNVPDKFVGIEIPITSGLANNHSWLLQLIPGDRLTITAPVSAPASCNGTFTVSEVGPTKVFTFVGPTAIYFSDVPTTCGDWNTGTGAAVTYAGRYQN